MIDRKFKHNATKVCVFSDFFGMKQHSSGHLHKLGMRGSF